MSILTEHSITGVIGNILALGEDSQRTEREAVLTAELKAGLGRIFTFTQLVRDLLERSAPEEVSLGGLGIIQSNLQQVYSELSAYFSNGNQAHLANAIPQIDNASNAFAWTFYNRPVRGARPQFESVDRVRAAAENAIERIEARTAEFQESLGQINSQIQQQDVRVGELSATMDEIRGSSSAAVSAVQQQFSESLSTFRSEIDAEKEKFRSQKDKLIEDFSKESEEFLAELEKQKDKAAKIVQVVGNIGVTGNYQLLADEQGTAANAWRFITVAIFAVGIVMVCASLYYHLIGDDVNLETLVIRFGIAAVITLPAFYAAAESARHRRVADKARQTELQLASLNPFLATLPEEKQQALIESLTPTYFGREPSEDASKAEPADTGKILEEVASFVTKIKAALS